MVSAIQRISHYSRDKYQGNKLRYPVDRDSSGEWRYLPFEPGASYFGQ